MTNIIFTPELCTGSKLIDDQNQILISSINEYANFAVNSQDPDLISARLDDLINYLKSHFHTEEQYMLRHRYPGISSHEHAHDKIIRRLITFNNMHKMGIKDMGRITASFIRNWIKSHIETSDTHFADYLKTKAQTQRQPSRINTNIINITPLNKPLKTANNHT